MVKPKKKADQMTNKEIVERLFPPEVIQKIKEINREKKAKTPSKGQRK